ncbi:MAG TPA: hypothetical protein VFP84_37685, partial [Kofleriaceae bacterium]|nr:hypothetical protein [Kofleriaceae bacterium]
MLRTRALLCTFLVSMATSAAAAPTAGVAASPPPAPPPLASPVERRLFSDDIDASSFLWNDWNKFVENYHPNYVADDDPSTAWVEGGKGSGAGEWLRIQTTPLDRTTRIRLHVRNGYQKSKDLFRANARARQVTLRLLPSKVEAKLTLEDRDGWQDLVIDQPSGVVRSVELAIDSVYDGTKYEDLCISDVQVFATSTTPDNPVFEKSKRQTLLDWRAARLAAAQQFKRRSTQLPLYPAYDVKAVDAQLDGYTWPELVALAAKEPGMAKEWAAPLAIAAEVAKNLDGLSRAQLAPTARDKLVAADGLMVSRMTNLVGEGSGLYDEGTLRLPMLDLVATLFVDRLRLLDVKDRTTVAQFLASEAGCKADLAWVRRAAASGDGAARVQALVVGRCARIETRNGWFNARAIELYVYDAAGRLALSLGDGHVDGYRWAEVDGRPMLAGGRALLT